MAKGSGESGKAVSGENGSPEKITRRGVLTKTSRRQTCWICHEQIMPGNVYEFRNIKTPLKVLKLYSHVACLERRKEARRPAERDSGLSDSLILKFWRDIDELEAKRKVGGE